jgi:FMN phosphatase YigB (HAD superfamily)
VSLPRWIFFDCCQTLLCVNDVGEYWTWMAPIPVEAGVCPSERAFNQAYAVWQKQRRQEAATDPHPENPLPEGLTQVLVALNPSVSPTEVETTVGDMIEAFYANYLPRTSPAHGVRQMLDAWQGVAKMGVVSDFFLRGCPRRMLARFGLDGCFEFILDSASVGFRKPATEIYQEALGQAGLGIDQAGEVLFVGDNLRLDVIAPASIGMRAMHYGLHQSSQPSKETGQSYPSIVHWDGFRPALIAEGGGAGWAD